MNHKKLSCQAHTHQNKNILLIFLINIFLFAAIFQSNVAAKQNSSYAYRDNIICDKYQEKHLIYENE